MDMGDEAVADANRKGDNMTARIAVAATIAGALIIAVGLTIRSPVPDDEIIWSPYGQRNHGSHIPIRLPNVPDTTVQAT